jgi:hypothetical protein
MPYIGRWADLWFESRTQLQETTSGGGAIKSTTVNKSLKALTCGIILCSDFNSATLLNPKFIFSPALLLLLLLLLLPLPPFAVGFRIQLSTAVRVLAETSMFLVFTRLLCSYAADRYQGRPRQDRRLKSMVRRTDCYATQTHDSHQRDANYRSVCHIYGPQVLPDSPKEAQRHLKCRLRKGEKTTDRRIYVTCFDRFFCFLTGRRAAPINEAVRRDKGSCQQRVKYFAAGVSILTCT